MSLIKKYKSLPDDAKGVAELLTSTETAGLALITLAEIPFLVNEGSYTGAILSSCVFCLSTVLTAHLFKRAIKDLSKNNENSQESTL